MPLKIQKCCCWWCWRQWWCWNHCSIHMRARKWSGVTLCSVCSKESEPYSHSSSSHVRRRSSGGNEEKYIQGWELEEEDVKRMRMKITRWMRMMQRRMLLSRVTLVVRRALLLSLGHWAVYCRLMWPSVRACSFPSSSWREALVWYW